MESLPKDDGLEYDQEQMPPQEEEEKVEQKEEVKQVSSEVTKVSGKDLPKMTKKQEKEWVKM